MSNPLHFPGFKSHPHYDESLEQFCTHLCMECSGFDVQAYAPLLGFKITCNMKTVLKSPKHTICIELSGLSLLDPKTICDIKTVLSQTYNAFAWTSGFYV